MRDIYCFNQCSSEDCRFRFPAEINDERGSSCPMCGSATAVAARCDGSPDQQNSQIADNELKLVAILDNIRSAYNVGSMFRTADGVGIEHVYLCGISPTPKHSKVSKTALGSHNSVGWSYHRNGLDLVEELKDLGYSILGLESTSREPVDSPQSSDRKKLALVVGNELAGVDPHILDSCDAILHLPMMGVKESLNVEVAFGIAAYQIKFPAYFAARFR